MQEYEGQVPGRGVEPFWTFMAERGRWRRQWRERIVRVLGPVDTSAVWRVEDASTSHQLLCDCCITGQPHSQAYHAARARQRLVADVPATNPTNGS
ncbi:MAG TPA: hypothetical protein VGW38_02210 [Chloroflexota bacterium]|nr:hypothetical protein [Chloroflexota bacterium]